MTTTAYEVLAFLRLVKMVALDFLFPVLIPRSFNRGPKQNSMPMPPKTRGAKR